MSDPGYISGGDTGVSYEDLVQRRALAQALAKQGNSYPKTFGEGLASIGQSIGQALNDRAVMKQQLAADQQRQTLIGNLVDAMRAQNAADTSQPSSADTSQPSAPAAPSSPPQDDSLFAGSFGRPTPGYIAQTLAENESDPTMRNYYGALAAAEAPGGADSVSPTGASGPFQFTRATGRQYGLVGDGYDKRADIAASLAAVQQLTKDNARQFESINGRPPTLAELAVMHQQGGVTGARMAAGTGNASPGALAVNNIDPNASPQQAAAGIKAYYGMPNITIPQGYEGTSRGQIANTLAVQNQPPAADGTNAPVQQQPTVTDISIAPPAIAPKMPPKSTAQLQAEATAMMSRDPQTVSSAQFLAKQLEDDRQAKYKNAVTQYNADVQARSSQQNIILQDRLRAPELALARAKDAREAEAARQTGVIQQQTIEKGKREATTAAQFGDIPPETVHKALSDSAAVARPAAMALVGIDQAEAALAAGQEAQAKGQPGTVITGSGAPFRLNWAKIMPAMGKTDQGSDVANTEVFKAAINPVISTYLKIADPNSPDYKFAQQILGGDLTLDAKTMPRVLSMMKESLTGVVRDHQNQLTALYPNPTTGAQAYALYGADIPPTPLALQKLDAIPHPTQDQMNGFDALFGPGAAARALRKRP